MAGTYQIFPTYLQTALKINVFKYNAPSRISTRLHEETRLREWGRCTMSPRLLSPRPAIAPLRVGFSVAIQRTRGATRDDQPHNNLPWESGSLALMPPLFLSKVSSSRSRSRRRLARVWMGHRWIDTTLLVPQNSEYF